MNSNHQLPGSGDQPVSSVCKYLAQGCLLLNALPWPDANAFWAHLSFLHPSPFFSLDVTLPKAQSGDLCSLHFAFFLQGIIHIYRFEHHLPRISLALCVRTPRGTSELHLCVWVRLCGAIHWELKPFSGGLTFGRTGFLFSSRAAGICTVKSRTKKGAVGSMAWDWSLKKRESLIFFFSRLYWNKHVWSHMVLLSKLIT